MNDNYSTEHKEMLASDPTPDHNPGFFEGLEAKLDEEPAPGVAPKTNILRRHWVSFASTAAVAAVAVALLATTTLTSSNTGNKKNEFAGPAPTVTTAPPVGTPTVPTTPTTAPTQTTTLQLTLAAQIGQRAAASYAKITSIGGTVTRTHSDEAVQVRQFKSRADGSYLYSIASGDTAATATVNHEESYNSQTGDAYTFEGDTVKHSYSNVNFGGGVSIYGGFSPYELLDGLALDQNANVVDTTLNGVKVWKIDSKLPNQIVGLGDIAPIGLNEIVAYFDQSTLFPLRIEAGGYTSVVSNLKTNVKYSDDDLKLNNPSADSSTTYDANEKRMTIDQIQKASGKTVLLPTKLPEGFVLSKATWDDKYGRVSVAYTSGLQSIGYTLDFKGNYPSKWTAPYEDPWFNLNETNATRTKVKVQGGKYDGLNMTLVASSATAPHAEVDGSSTTMYVGGDITTDDLQLLINSIK